jgi:hypothetical protein
MAPEIRFLRLRQAVTREELKTTLQGSFENASFPSATLADVVDLDSLFVQGVPSPVDGVTAAVYELNIKAKEDLAPGVPYWTTWQKYYFVQSGTAWTMIAIQ